MQTEALEQASLADKHTPGSGTKKERCGPLYILDGRASAQLASDLRVRPVGIERTLAR